MTDERRYIDIAPRASNTGTPSCIYPRKTGYFMHPINNSDISLSHCYDNMNPHTSANTPNYDAPATALLFDASSSRFRATDADLISPSSKTRTFLPVPSRGRSFYDPYLHAMNTSSPLVTPHCGEYAMPAHNSFAVKSYPNSTMQAFLTPTKNYPELVVGCSPPLKRSRTEPSTCTDAPRGISKDLLCSAKKTRYLPRNSNSSSLGTGSRANFAHQNRNFELARGAVDDLIDVLLNDNYGKKQILTRLAEEMKSEKDKKVLLELSSKISQSKMLTFIPRFESYDSFRRWANSAGGFRQIIEHLSPTAESLSLNEPKNVENIMMWISEHYPNNFKKVAREKLGNVDAERMDAIATLALMKDLGLNEHAALTKLNKHLEHHLGIRPICTRTDIMKMKEKCPTPTVTDTFLPGKDETDPQEKVHVLQFGMGDMISAELSRFLEEHIKSEDTKNLHFGDINKSYFIYDCGKDKNDGIWALIGTDHGKGASQFVIRLLLLPSSERKTANSPKFGTISCPFANIRCRKESKKSLDIMTDSIDKGLNLLKDSKIIAVVDNNNKVHTTFVPKDTTKIAIEPDRILVEREGREEMSVIVLPTHLSQTGVKRWFTVVGNTNVLQIGDLSAQMILQGRSGMSSKRCIHCKSTQKGWKSREPVVNLTEEDMQEINKMIGMTYLRLWKIAPLDCVIPVLHLFLGTVNYQLFKKIVPYMSSLEEKSQEEEETMRKLEEVSAEIESFSRSLKSRNDFCTDEDKRIRSDIREKGRKVKELRKTSSKFRIDSPEAMEIRKLIVELKMEIEMLQDQWGEIQHDLIEMRSEMKKKRHRKNALSKSLKELVKKRESSKGSMKNFFVEVLHKAGVDIKVWHGGTLTGPSIMKIFRNLKQIMEKLKNEAIRVIECNKDRNRDLPDLPSCKRFFERHTNLLEIQDAVYAHLRIIAPTKIELNRTRKLISFMKIHWLDLGCSLTPKAHLLFEHAYEQMVRIGGLGDKCEDPLERIHQEHDKAEITYKRMNNIEQRMKYQAQYMWLMSHPSVDSYIKKVYKKRSNEEIEDDRNDAARLDNSPVLLDRLNKKKKTLVSLKTVNRRRRRVRKVEKMMAES